MHLFKFTIVKKNKKTLKFTSIIVAIVYHNSNNNVLYFLLFNKKITISKKLSHQ